MGSSHCVSTSVGSMYRVSKIPGFPRCPVPAASGVFARRGDRERHGSLPGRQRFQVISEQGKAPGEAGGGKKLGKRWEISWRWRKGQEGLAVRREPDEAVPSWHRSALALLGPALGTGSLRAPRLQGKAGMESWDGWDALEPQTLYNSLSTARQRTCSVSCATNPSKSGGAGGWSTAKHIKHQEKA